MTPLVAKSSAANDELSRAIQRGKQKQKVKRVVFVSCIGTGYPCALTAPWPSTGKLQPVCLNEKHGNPSPPQSPSLVHNTTRSVATCAARRASKLCSSSPKFWYMFRPKQLRPCRVHSCSACADDAILTACMRRSFASKHHLQHRNLGRHYPKLVNTSTGMNIVPSPASVHCFQPSDRPNEGLWGPTLRDFG